MSSEQAAPAQEPPKTPQPGGPVAPTGGLKSTGRFVSVDKGKASESAIWNTPLHPLFDENWIVRELKGASFDSAGLEGFLPKFRPCDPGGAWAVVCTDPGRAEWAATFLALAGKFDFRYRLTAAAVAQWTFEEIADELIRRRESTCMIIDCSSPEESTFFRGKVRDLVEATSKRRDKNFGLIIYTRYWVYDAVSKAEGWPENLPCFFAPEIRFEADEDLRNVKPRDFYEGLSVKGSTPEEVLADEPRKFIPRTLAQLGVLFPDLPVSEFERVTRAALAARGRPLISIPRDIGRGNAEYEAIDIWAARKVVFERQAGLVRIGNDAAAQVCFASTPLADAAGAWAWRDRETMFDIFDAVSRLYILFGDDTESGDRVLFEKYMAAAAELGRRTPTTFANRWLNTLYGDYFAWVRQAIPDDIPVNGGLANLVVLVDRSEQRRKLWRHFCKRFAAAAQYLMKDSAPAVERFLDQLERHGAYSLELSILQELAAIFGAKRFERLKRLLDDFGDDDLEQATVKQLAQEICKEPEAAIRVFQALATWIPDAASRIKKRSASAALAVPAAVLNLLTRRDSDTDAEGVPFPAVLDASFDAGDKRETVEEFWREIFVRPEFGAVAVTHTLPADVVNEMDAANRRTLGIARTLWQFIFSLPDDQFKRGLAFAKEVQGAGTFELRTLVKDFWRDFADYFAGERNALSKAGPDARSREYYDRCHRICLELTRL